MAVVAQPEHHGCRRDDARSVAVPGAARWWRHVSAVHLSRPAAVQRRPFLALESRGRVMAQLPSVGDLVLLACSLLSILASIVRFELPPADPHARRSSFVLLCAGALGLRLFVARLDPYLNLWDEQFHALVARPMSATTRCPRASSLGRCMPKVWRWRFSTRQTCPTT